MTLTASLPASVFMCPSLKSVPVKVGVQPAVPVQISSVQPGQKEVQSSQFTGTWLKAALLLLKFGSEI